MNAPIQDEESVLSAISFVGTTLGPFFLFDPVLNSDAINESFCVMAELSVEAAAEEWPFVSAHVASSALGSMRDDAGAHPEELAGEFRRLFVGPASKAAPPWGSVYTDRDCVVFGRSCMDLHEWMMLNGVSIMNVHDTNPTISSDDPEDHIGMMLLLMAWLSENRPELLRDYLSQHFLTWAPHFLKLMDEASSRAFYCGLARLTLASLLGIQDALELRVEEPHFYR